MNIFQVRDCWIEKEVHEAVQITAGGVACHRVLRGSGQRIRR
ncbi:MAG TPA: hypothetical protein VF463_14020 [Sphingobium sp.]